MKQVRQIQASILIFLSLSLTACSHKKTTLKLVPLKINKLFLFEEIQDVSDREIFREQQINIYFITIYSTQFLFDSFSTKAKNHHKRA